MTHQSTQSKQTYSKTSRRRDSPEVPGKIGEAPPTSPLVMAMAVRFRVTFLSLLEHASASPSVPATPLSALEPLKLSTLLTSLNPNDLKELLLTIITVRTLIFSFSTYNDWSK